MSVSDYPAYSAELDHDERARPRRSARPASASPERSRRGGGLAAFLFLLLLCALAFGAAYFRFVVEPLSAHSAAADERTSELERSIGALEERAARLEQELTATAAERDRLQTERGGLESRLEERDAQIAQLETARRDLESRLGSEIASGDIELHGTDGRMSIGLSDQILFPSGGAELSPRGQAVLTRVAQSLASLPGRLIQVEGHTDSTALSPQLAERYASNWELSTARATHVVRFLMEQCAIPGERLVASGLSEFQPRASNRTPAGRQRNRRIELNLVPMPASPTRHTARSQ